MPEELKPAMSMYATRADALTAQAATIAAQASQIEALRAQLRLFTGAAYPVSTDIDPRGYRWSEAYLDAALQASETGGKAVTP